MTSVGSSSPGRPPAPVPAATGLLETVRIPPLASLSAAFLWTEEGEAWGPALCVGSRGLPDLQLLPALLSVSDGPDFGLTLFGLLAVRLAKLWGPILRPGFAGQLEQSHAMRGLPHRHQAEAVRPPR